jgi:hypothetical protein
VMRQKNPELSENGVLGVQTAKLLLTAAPKDFPQPEINLSNDLASRIVKYMQGKQYKVFAKPQEYNIIYVEGMNPDGTLNDDAPNEFNDVRMVIEFVNGIPEIIECWEGTTEPGRYHTDFPKRPEGAARIKFGQYKAWRVDFHGEDENHEALVQFGEVTVHRDYNRDMQRTNDKLDTSDKFWINQHWGYNYDRNDIQNASAGCLVGRTTEGHKAFMAIVKQDERYKKNSDYMFYTTVIAGDDLDRCFPP